VGDRSVTVGTLEFAAAGAPPAAWARAVARRSSLEAVSMVFVAIDDRLAGAVVLEDPLRPETPRVVRELRRQGFSRVVMLTGDHHAVAEVVGAAIGVDAVLAERQPREKVDAVVDERQMAAGAPLLMVGDGLNDAPALAVADVGVAMGARGASAASEAADVVITVDRLDRLVEAVTISRRSRAIAVQSVVAGMSMSLIAMGFAAFGFLPVVAGAILQEGIDVAVILNALRALRGGEPRARTLPGWDGVRRRLTAEHGALAAGIARLREVADRIDEMPKADLPVELGRIGEFLEKELLPHEMDEDRAIYLSVSTALGSDDATAPLHRTHTEIFHLAGRLGRLVDSFAGDDVTADDRADVRRILYALDAILRLHMAQEEELYQSLAGDVASELAVEPA
jgi:soluble P-type ATPase